MASANRTLAKYNHPPLQYYPAIAAGQNAQGDGGLVRRTGSSGTVALSDKYQSTGQFKIDSNYYGPSAIGTPAQGFQLDPDTGSADLFVEASSCPQDQCGTTSRYNPGGSNTAQDLNKTANITYGSGSIMGKQYRDKVTLAGLTVASQTFIAVEQASGFATFGADGLLGMAFSTIAATEAPTFFENLIAAGSVAEKVFSFYLGRGESGTQANSELMLGGRNTDKFTGAATVVPVTKRGYWQVKIDGVKVQKVPCDFLCSLIENLFGGLVNLTQGQAAIDTGTTLIIAPTLAASQVFSAIPGSMPIVSGTTTLWAFPCKSASEYTVSLVFAGEDFAVNSLDFNLGSLNQQMGQDMGNSTLAKLLNPDLCLSAITGADLDPLQSLYVVGDSFLKNWYSSYNYEGETGDPQVEFAQAI